MPPIVPVSNPVDLTAQSLVDPGMYGRVLSALAQDNRFGSIAIGIIQTGPATCQQKFPHIIEAIRQLRTTKPILLAGLDEGAEVPAEYISQLRALSVPYFPATDRALRALARLNTRKDRSAQPRHAVTLSLASTPPPGVVTEYRAKELLAPLGIPFPAGKLVKTLDEAQAAASHVGFPLVLKAQSAHLSHKSDAGGVILGIQDVGQLAVGWQKLHDNIAASLAGRELEGVLLEKQAPSGIELIIGGRNDPQWGPIILIGFGGVQAELLRDVRLLPPGLNREDILPELAALKFSPLLTGFRGAPAADTAAIATLIENVSDLLVSEPSLAEVDLNPVIVYPQGQGALALDALMVMSGRPT
jgi:acyl-CoA synthetase (NDP forming)